MILCQFVSKQLRRCESTKFISTPNISGAKYIKGLFAAFDRIASRGVLSKPVPAEFGVSGFFFRYERHIVYWRYLSGGDIGIVSILHERMHQIDRFADDFGSGPT